MIFDIRSSELESYNRGKKSSIFVPVFPISCQHFEVSSFVMHLAILHQLRSCEHFITTE